MALINFGYWEDRRVLVTGHTGFKGAWLSLFLTSLNASITGYALEHESSLYDHLEPYLPADSFNSVIGDITDKDKLSSCISQFQPEVIFHLAAQPLVSEGYEKPFNTWHTNLTGTLNLLDSLSQLDQCCSVIIVTTDKVYKNYESNKAYSENSEISGYDPYSASKAAIELLVDSWRHSTYFIKRSTFLHKISTVRSGNVIGGGDWSSNRIVPDLVTSLNAHRPVNIRSPLSVRPWQHVLDTLYGYILLAQTIADNFDPCFHSFNFGPDPSSSKSVLDLVERAFLTWPGSYICNDTLLNHETSYLTLSSQKASTMLKWNPILSFNETVDLTIGWYKDYYNNLDSPYNLTLSNIRRFISSLNE